MSRIKTLMKTLSHVPTLAAALVLTLVLFASAGCQRKELLEPHDHYNLIIKANFDSLGLSQLLSHKSDGYTQPGEPKSTSYILYEKNTQKIAYRGQFKGLEGRMYVQEGLYDLLVYTTDFNEYDANFFRGMDNKETAETHTRQSVFGESRMDVVEMFMVEPDPTFSVLKEDVAVFQGLGYNNVEVEFVQKSFKYYLTVKCTGLQHIHSAKMNISGMYTSAFLTNEEHRMNEAATQSVDMKIIHHKSDNPEDLGKGEIYGEFWSFGPNLREDIVNSITLYFLNGGERVIMLDDLTGQIKKLTRGGEIIVEQVIEIKGPPSGFDPGVGDWNDPTDVEIIL